MLRSQSPSRFARPVQNFRSQRLATLIQRELSQFFLQDSAFQDVVLTAVELSKDYRYAKVFFRESPWCDLQETTAPVSEQLELMLLRHQSKIRGFLGRRVKMKFVPELRFQYDCSIDQALKIEKLLKDCSQINEHSD